MSLSDIFRANLNMLMEKQGISQGELARRAGFTRQYANQLVRAQRDVTLLTLQKISDVLGVTAWAMLRPDCNDSLDNPELSLFAELMVDASPAERKMALRVCQGIMRETHPKD